MDFISDFINNINVGDNPTMYYVGALLFVIVIIVMVRTFLQMILVFAALSILVLALLYFSGNPVQQGDFDITSASNTIKNQYHVLKNKFLGKDQNSGSLSNESTENNTESDDSPTPSSVIDEVIQGNQPKTSSGNNNNEQLGIVRFIINLFSTIFSK